MEDKVHCPKCNSPEVTAQKHGFSAGKAAAGAVLTGGVGILAGLHGSTDVDITCLNCGYKWSPKKLFEEKKKEQLKKEYSDLKKWKQGIYNHYDKKDFQEAEQIYLSKYSFNARLGNIHEVYKFYKKTDRQLAFITIGFIAVIILVLIWIFS